jgi:hypothetical protein
VVGEGSGRAALVVLPPPRGPWQAGALVSSVSTLTGRWVQLDGKGEIRQHKQSTQQSAAASKVDRVAKWENDGTSWEGVLPFPPPPALAWLLLISPQTLPLPVAATHVH